jgi:hypothetical protein
MIPWRRTSATLFSAILLGGFLIAPQRGVCQLLQGTIDGRITDPSQAAIVGAKVNVTNQETNFWRDVITGTQGEYNFASLPPGTYTLTVKAQGFQSFVKTGVVVNANESVRSDAILTIGQVSESVTVSSQAATLQADRSDVHSDLTPQALNQLPLPSGRNYQMLLAVVVPGVSQPQSGQSFGANPSRAVGFSVNGASDITNSQRIDGTSSTNFNSPNKPMYSPALEAIENVNVVTNSPDAEQGIAGGAAVNISTKTGTNAVHGSVFEYYSNQRLQAYAWGTDSTQPKPLYHNNQFGGTIGGPIKKEKLFYFVSYQGTYTTLGNTLFAEVPTAAMVSGDLSASPTPIYDPRTGKTDGTGRTPFPKNRIPIDPGIQALLNMFPFPAPNQPGTGSLGLSRNYESTGTSDEKLNQYDTKLSWNANSKLSVFARFGLDRFSWNNPQQFGMLGGPGVSPSNTAVGTGRGDIYSGTASATYVFTSHLIADAYYGYTRNDATADQQLLGQNLGSTLLQIPGLQTSNPREGGLPALEIDGFGGKGTQIPEATIGPANNFQPQGYGNVEKEWVGNVTWVKVRHNLRAGVDFDQQQDNESFLQATFCTFCTGSGGFQFSQGTTQLKGGPAGNDYNAFAAFLLGFPANAGKVTLNPPQYHNYANIFGTYIRDQWQASSKLTVTLGTRWDYYPFATRGSRGMEYLDAATNQMIICGVAGNPKNCGITKDTQRFEPRGGVAYRVTDTIVLRAGYGLSTDPTFVGGTSGNRQNFPDLSVSTLTAPNSFSYATTLRVGLPVTAAPDLSSGRVPVPTTSGVFTVDNHTYSRGYIQSWNVSLEQQFGSWIGSLGYVATRTIHPFAVLNANWSPIGTGSAGQVLNVLAGRTGITSTPGSEGISKYDSLQATLSHSFANNFQASAAYTWAHGSGYSTQVAIPAYYSLNYGPLANIARHSVGLTAVVSSPFGKNQRWMQNGFGSAILGGWQLQGISTLRTGMRFTVTDSNTSLNASGSTQFADCIGTAVKLGKISQWYSTATFAHPAAGRFGTCTTNSLVGPGLVTLDTGVSRTFALKEHLRLEVRALLFNTPNTPHHANPTSSLNSSSFMQALGIANTGRDGIDQRTGQFSARLAW